MSAAEFIERMRARGLYVQVEERQLVMELEDGAARPTAEERRRLQELKPEIIAYLSGIDWSRVSLYQLDRILEVAVPWSDVNLVIAPGCRIARELRARDPKPGRVWCCCEIADLLLSGVRPEDARATAEAKILFGGAVAGVHVVTRNA